MRKVAEFLNKDLSNEIIGKIAENCSFDQLKAANDTKKKADVFLAERKAMNAKNEKKPFSPPNMYRKGICLIELIVIYLLKTRKGQRHTSTFGTF